MAEGRKVNVDDDNSTGKEKKQKHDHHCKFVNCLRIIQLTVLQKHHTKRKLKSLEKEKKIKLLEIIIVV